ncbi:MAG: hypothetical protein IKW83_00695 [Muribaculaceae bacterium]|nr:hypothetical protein [Muribaculaceae bacterium]
MRINYSLSKEDNKKLKEIIKRGILRCCEQWLEETNKIISKEYDEKENAFDRCMEITLRSKKFYKEAMRREDYYRTSMLLIGAANLLVEGYLTADDFEECSEEVTKKVLLLADD